MRPGIGGSSAGGVSVCRRSSVASREIRRAHSLSASDGERAGVRCLILRSTIQLRAISGGAARPPCRIWIGPRPSGRFNVYCNQTVHDSKQACLNLI